MMDKFSLQELLPQLLNPSIEEHRLINVLQQLRSSFTEKRQINDYINDIDFVSAYTSFYFPTNYVKFEWLMSLLNQDLIAEMKGSELVDYGCGPGTFALAWLSFFGHEQLDNSLLPVNCIDQSELMLKQAKKLFKWRGLHDPKHYFGSKVGHLTAGKKTLLFGHSLNEMSLGKALHLIDGMVPDFIMIIEPGTSAVFKKLLEMRKALLDRDYSIHYPCPEQSKCPMEGSENDWCHQVMRVTHDPSIERLSQKVKIDRRTMPITFHLYSKKKANILESESARTIQFINETKFSFNYKVCYQNKIVQFEILKKDLSKNEKKEFKGINIGELLHFHMVKELDKDRFRIKLKGER